MYLKKIELVGFKSFGGRSAIEFNQGLVAIVGPNGSGKSNVADAVRWVLGEQSTRLLRLNKSEELIFAGTDKKAMASMAEVSLLLDNSQARMSVDAPEVEIVRRLYRSGESEYRLNGKKVRLGELQELLAQAGFGQNSYTVIGQGMVEKMLLTPPRERKELFEEASGTKQFEIRRARYIKSLEQTRQNMVELQQLISELEPQHAAALADSAALAARHELEGQIRDAKQALLLTEVIQTKANLAAIETNIARYTAQRDELHEKYNLLQAQREEHNKQREDMQKQRRRAIADHTKLSAERLTIAEQIAVLKAQQAMVGTDTNADKQHEKAELTKQLKTIVKKVATIEGKIGSVTERIADYDKKVTHIESVLKELNTLLGSHRRHLQRGQKREYLNHALGLLNLLAHNDNVATMDKADRELALHKMRRMIKLALEDQSELIAQEITSLQTKITRQMSKREELAEQRNMEIIRLRGLELDQAGYQEDKVKCEERIAELTNLVEADARHDADSVTALAKQEATLRAKLAILDDGIAKAQQIIAVEENFVAGQANKQDRAIEDLIARQAEISTLLQEETRQAKQLTKQLQQKQSAYETSYGSLTDTLAAKPHMTAEQLAKLEARLEATERIEASSIQRAQELGERLKRLQGQYADLEGAANDTEALITRLDKDIQKRFTDNFQAINKKFGHFFGELFGGGTGQLVYQARDDGEYGIEITATPPGKRTQQLAMLSGGERSLGAIALLAAIMAVNPSPFVVLDEVDAALDDANSQKFNKILKELEAKIQLIVITHNHETMQAAQQLIGITSDTHGVAMAVSAQLSSTTPV